MNSYLKMIRLSYEIALDCVGHKYIRSEGGVSTRARKKIT